MRPEQPIRVKRDDPEESSWDEGAVGLSGSITALTEGRIKIKPKPFQFGFHAPAMSEREKFAAAFVAIHARGEKPTPGALNREQGYPVRRAIPGRLSGLRIELLQKVGYTFDEATRRWELPC